MVATPHQSVQSPKWWMDLTLKEQQKYLKDHPGSNFKINAHPDAVHKVLRTAGIKKHLNPGSGIRRELATKFREISDSDKIKRIKDALNDDDFQVIVGGAEAVLDPSSVPGVTAGDKVSYVRKSLKIALPILAAALSGYWGFSRYEMLVGDVATTLSPTMNGVLLAVSALSFARSAKHIYNEVNQNDIINNAPDIPDKIIHSSSDRDIRAIQKMMNIWADDLAHSDRLDIGLLLRGAKVVHGKQDFNKIEADFIDDAHIDAIEYSKADEKNRVMQRFNHNIRSHKNMLIGAINKQNAADVEAMQYIKQFNEGHGVGLRGTVSIVKMFRRVHKEAIRKLDNIPDYKVGSFVLIGGITIAFFNTIISIAFVVLLFLLAYGALMTGFAITRFLNLNKLKMDSGTDVWKDIREGRNPDNKELDDVDYRVMSGRVKDDLMDQTSLFMDRLFSYIEKRGGNVLNSKNIKMMEKIL